MRVSPFENLTELSILASAGHRLHLFGHEAGGRWL